MTQMLAVMAAPAAENWPLLGRGLQLGFGHYCEDRGPMLFLELARVGGDSPAGKIGEHLIDLEQFRAEAPAPVEALSHALSAFVGSVAEPDRPVGGQLAVIGNFFDALRRDGRDALVFGIGQPL